MKTIIISAADRKYFTPLKSLFLSLEANANQQFDTGVLDIGLKRKQISWLLNRGVVVITPEWDIEFPNKDARGDKFKAMVSRPFLQKYFSGYDFYIWLDADAWLQDSSSIDLLMEGARRSGISITPEIDRSYQAFYNRGYTRNWMRNLYLKGWGEQIANKLVEFPIINSGVWCIEANHPIWASWQDSLACALQNSQNFYIEQTAFNFSIHTRNDWNPHLLPAITNWNCAHALPLYDSENGYFVEPFLPYLKIGIVHLCGIYPKDKKIIINLTSGESKSICLLFSEGVFNGT